MERFYLKSVNSRGNRREGGLQAGQPVTVTGKTAGLIIVPRPGIIEGSDRFQVYMTTGSTGTGGDGSKVYLGTVRDAGLPRPVWDENPENEWEA